MICYSEGDDGAKRWSAVMTHTEEDGREWEVWDSGGFHKTITTEREARETLQRLVEKYRKPGFLGSNRKLVPDEPSHQRHVTSIAQNEIIGPDTVFQVLSDSRLESKVAPHLTRFTLQEIITILPLTAEECDQFWGAFEASSPQQRSQTANRALKIVQAWLDSFTAHTAKELESEAAVYSRPPGNYSLHPQAQEAVLRGFHSVCAGERRLGAIAQPLFERGYRMQLADNPKIVQSVTKIQECLTHEAEIQEWMAQEHVITTPYPDLRGMTYPRSAPKALST